MAPGRRRISRSHRVSALELDPVEDNLSPDREGESIPNIDNADIKAQLALLTQQLAALTATVNVTNLPAASSCSANPTLLPSNQSTRPLNSSKPSNPSTPLKQPTASQASAATPISFAVDLSRDLPTYDGEGAENAREWLTAWNATITIHSLADCAAVEIARRTLTGAAKSWYLRCRERITTVPTFCKLFHSAFLPERDTVELTQLMLSRTQQPGEHIMVYIHDKLRLIQPLNLPMADVRKYVASGCNWTNLKSHIITCTAADEDKLVSSIRMFVECHPTLPKTSNSRIQGKPPTPTKQTVTATSKISKTAATSTTSAVSASNDSMVKCYNCFGTGHMSKECPAPRRTPKCTACNQMGHVKSKCTATTVADSTTAQNSTKQVTAAIKVSDNVHSGDKYIKKAVINGREISGVMIDPGSAVCVISATEAIRLGEFLTKSDTVIYGVGDHKGTQSLGKFSATIAIDDIAIPGIEILVMPDATLPVPVIIGRTWTDHSDVVMLRIREQLIFEEASKWPFNNYPNTGNTLSHNDVCELERVTLNYIAASNDELWVPLSADNFKFGESITDNDREKFMEIINCHRKAFATNVFELGTANCPPIEIIEKPGSRPVATRPFRSHRSDAIELTRQLEEWRRAGIIEDTDSPYAAPAFLVGKKDGKKRPVFDFRKLNAQTEPMHFPLPSIDDHLLALSNATSFTVLDLASGYLQIPIAPESRPKTAFITETETGQFTRLPFGLRNAPAEFSRVMARILGKLRNDMVFNYLDDVLIPATNLDEMRERLKIVLNLLQASGLACRPEKCAIAVEVVEFLGFEISRGEIRPGKAKVNAIAAFPIPKNVREIRSFVGLTSFFRRFLKNFATRIAPITALTRKNIDFSWTPVQDHAFADIKNALIEPPVLRLFNPAASTELHTDASHLGIAGMLFQRDGNSGPWHLVYAVSKKTTDAEARYHSSKLELLAIVWSVTRLRQFLLTIPFVIITDCQALLHLNSHKTRNSQVARWALALQEFDFVVRHRPGEKMQHVDALSRAPVNEPTDTEELVNDRVTVFSILSDEEIVAMYQRKDDDIRNIIDNIQAHPSFEIHNGLLYRNDVETGRKLFVIPKAMRKSLCIRFHDQMGHFSLEKVVYAMKRKYWFAGMRRYVRVHIRACIECLLAKGTSGKSQGLLKPVPPGKRPFETVNVDHLGPFVETTAKNTHIFVLVDNLTKFVRLWPVLNTSTQEVENCLNSFIMENGAPDRIITDRGSCFTTNTFLRFCQNRGITVHHVPTRHPRANGQVERVNRILNAQLTIYAASSIEETENWDRFLPEIQRNINTSVNRSTGKAPFELLYGYVPRFADSTLDKVVQLASDVHDLDVVRHIAREHIEQSQQKMKEAFDKKHCVGDHLEPGEIIFVRCPNTAKLQPKFRGPMVVVERVSGDIYRIQDLRREGTPVGLVDLHISQIRPWRADLTDDPSDDEQSEPGSGEDA